MSLLPNASFAGTTENFWQPATGTINITGGLNVSGLIQAGLLNVAGLADVGALTTAGAVTAGSVEAGSGAYTGAVTATSVTASGAVTGGSLVTAGAVSATSGGFSGAVTAGSVSATSLVATAGYNSVALASAPLTGSYVQLGPTFTRPCIVGVNVSNTTTPASPAGNITQNRYFLVRLVFTDTGTNLLTDTILIDSNVGGAGSNINIQWNSASGRFQFYSNASPIQPTAITFAIMNQA